MKPLSQPSRQILNVDILLLLSGPLCLLGDHSPVCEDAGFQVGKAPGELLPQPLSSLSTVRVSSPAPALFHIDFMVGKVNTRLFEILEFNVDGQLYADI